MERNWNSGIGSSSGIEELKIEKSVYTTYISGIESIECVYLEVLWCLFGFSLIRRRKLKNSLHQMKRKAGEVQLQPPPHNISNGCVCIYNSWRDNSIEYKRRKLLRERVYKYKQNQQSLKKEWNEKKCRTKIQHVRKRIFQWIVVITSGVLYGFQSSSFVAICTDICGCKNFKRLPRFCYV